MAANPTGDTVAQQSLSTGTARQIATTTKTIPQMLGITPRWFLKLLPWVQMEAWMYRVNRCKVVLRKEGHVHVRLIGEQAKIEARDLRMLALFQDLDDGILEELASKFANEKYEAGDVIIESGQPGDKFYIIRSAQQKIELCQHKHILAGKKQMI